MTVQLTRHCNLNCYYCYCHPLHGKVNGLGFEPLISFLEACRPYSTAGLTLTGGEPLIYPHIEQLLRYLREKKQYVAIETNGSLLSNKFLEDFAENGAHVAVTLESVRANEHDQIRGQENWCLATDALRRALSFGKITTQFTFNLTPASKGDLPEVCELGMQLGVKRIKLNPIYKIGPRGRSSTKNKYLTVDDLLDIAEFWDRNIYKKYPMAIDLALPPALLPPSSRHDQRQCVGCELTNILGVLYDGSIRPCHNFIFDGQATRFGSIYEEYSIPEILKQISSLRGSSFLDLTGICRRCALVTHCKGFCRAQSNVDFGNTAAPNKLCAELYDTGRFPAELIVPSILSDADDQSPVLRSV